MQTSTINRDMNSPKNQTVQGFDKLYRYPNGWVASVIRKETSYGGKSGLFEIALGNDQGIVYNHPFMPEGISGWLTWSQVCNKLKQIKNLPAAS